MYSGVDKMGCGHRLAGGVIVELLNTDIPSHTCLYKYFFIASDITPSCTVGEEDRFDILTEMMSIASSWKAIGTGLRIDSGRLDAIQDSYPGKPRECLSEMLTCWLKRNYNVERFGEPTWRAVVKVAAHPAAGDNCALALNIAKQHSGNIQNVFV